MRAFTYWLGAALLTITPLVQAQQPAYVLALTEPDQELDDFTYRFASTHSISARMRGVRGNNNTVYWVSADGKQLTAYKQGQQVWQANVSQAFAKVLPGARIKRMVLSSGFLFIFTDRRGHAEIDRSTGNVSAVGVDPN